MKTRVSTLRITILCVALLVLTQLACVAGGAGTAPTPTLIAFPTLSSGGDAATQPIAPAAVGATGGAVDACTLLTQKDAETIFGASSQPGTGTGEEYNGIFTASCTYYSTDNAQFVTINVAHLTTPANAGVIFARADSSLEHIPGLGDDAVWDTIHFGLTVAKGNWWYSLTGTVTGGSSPTKEQWLPIAQNIVGLIP